MNQGSQVFIPTPGFRGTGGLNRSPEPSEPPYIRPAIHQYVQRLSTEQVEMPSDDSMFDPLTLIEEPQDGPLPEPSEEEALLRKAERYQADMKGIPIPVLNNVIPYKTWVGLARSMKQIYKQPLHYLTNLQLRNWDRDGLGAEDARVELKLLIHPVEAEITIWKMEEVHRRTTSPGALARYWKDDPDYGRYIDDIQVQPNIQP